MWSTPAAWQVSYRAGGSPGDAETAAPPAQGSIVINELLEHSSGALGDRVELLNTTVAAIDISGCILRTIRST